jgi:hypothetical protein
MCGEHHNLIVKCRYDALYSIRRNTFDALLNHMVSILITNTAHHMPIQLRHQLCLLNNIYHLQCLLNNSAAIHLEAECQNMSYQLTCQIMPLLGCAMLKKLLDHIVAKNTSHECQGMRKHFLENHALLIWASSLQFLLDEAAPMLISTLHSQPNTICFRCCEMLVSSKVMTTTSSA